MSEKGGELRKTFDRVRSEYGETFLNKYAGLFREEEIA